MSRITISPLAKFMIRLFVRRKGQYLGKTVQVVPHITNEIQDFILPGARIGADDEARLQLLK